MKEPIEKASVVRRFLLVQLVGVFLIAATTFIAMRSSDYLAVDGALRGLQVYHLQKPVLHANNHLFYPVNVYIWSTVLRGLGVRPDGPLEFLAIVQAMNAIAAAGCLTVMYGLAYMLTRRAAVAALVVGSYGLSHAFVVHATNSAEPMVGLLWSLSAMALLLYGILRQGRWLILGAGLLVALAMATYQTMVLIGAPMLFVLWQCCDYREEYSFRLSRLSCIGYFLSGFGLGIPLIYGTAYYFSGTQTVAAMVGRFFGTGVAGITIGFNLLTVLPGFAYALLPCLPRGCGFRCLAAPEHRAWIPVAAAAVLVAGVALLTTVGLARKVWSQMSKEERLATLTCGVGFLSTLIPSLIWIPAYDKFWLQPLACFFLGAGIVCNAAWQLASNQPRRARLLPLWFCASLSVLMIGNLLTTWNAALRPTPYLAETEDLATFVGPHDLLVGDWNGIFLLYQALWEDRANSFNVPTSAMWEGSTSVAQLHNAVENTQKAGGKIFFLGILDLSESDWKSYSLGDPIQAPYGAFMEYRHCARTVKSFAGDGRRFTLREFIPCDKVSHSGRHSATHS